ncbi:MAG: hypothetical protein KDC92_16965 [Bacteroidetes bacterium]|nr:hypothetical protein [Bacteroidota bacterium]
MKKLGWIIGMLGGIGMDYYNPTQMVILDAGGSGDIVKKSPVERLLDKCDLPAGFTAEEMQELKEFVELRML